MTEIKALYTPDGEWLQLSTYRPGYSGGRLISIAPETNDVRSAIDSSTQASPDVSVVDLDAQGWAPTCSERGSFSLHAPENRELEDWSMQLRGLPRVYDALNRKTLSSIFDPAVNDLLSDIHKDILPHRESVGDLHATQAARGLVASSAIHDYLSISVSVGYDINRKTEKKRAKLINSAVYKSGVYVVARAVIIKS